MATRGKYRVIAIDRPGYIGETRTFTTRESAVAFAESFIATHDPRAKPAWAYGPGAYVLVERVSGYPRTEAAWDGINGAWQARKVG
jgi:hypothetical protein